MDATVVHQYLATESYWAKNIPLETVRRSISNAACLAIFDGSGNLVGFGRMITDYATFGYLADIFILKAHRGKGLSKKMVALFAQLADECGLRRTMLATNDAHGLYQQYGFEPLADPKTIMNRKGKPY